MNQGLTKPTSQTERSKVARPALIVSEHIVSEYSIFLERLLVGLAAESVPVALVCPPGSDIDYIVPPSVEVIGYPAFDLPFLWRQNRRILVERLEKFKPTVLHCLCESKALLTKRLAHQLDLPYVLTVNSLQRRFGQFSVSRKHCSRIIVPADSIAANIAKFHPKFAGRIERINMGTFTAETSGCFRETSRLASMVTAHRFDNTGEFENLVAAVHHLAIEGYEFMLVIIGDGRAEKQLRKLLSAHGLLQIVTIVPRLGRWRSVLAAGDIFIQPVASDIFNPLLLEAMSVGAAVAGCKGGVDDLIIDGKTAVLFDPSDELSIYSTLQRLFDRRDFARQLAGKAQEYLRKNYTVSGMISSILRVYHNAPRRPER